MTRFCNLPFLFALFTLACGASSESAPPACPQPAVALPAPEPANDSPPVARVGAIPFDLPKASDFAAPPVAPDGSGPEGELTPTLHVMLSNTGKLSLDGEEIANAEQLSRKAEEQKVRNPEVRVVIFADRTTSWAEIIEILDALKRGGIARLAFAVRVE